MWLRIFSNYNENIKHLYGRIFHNRFLENYSILEKFSFIAQCIRISLVIERKTCRGWIGISNESRKLKNVKRKNKTETYNNYCRQRKTNKIRIHKIKHLFETYLLHGWNPPRKTINETNTRIHITIIYKTYPFPLFFI